MTVYLWLDGSYGRGPRKGHGPRTNKKLKPSKKRFSFEGGRIVRIENTLVFSWDVREADFGILEGRSRREQEDERKKTTSGGRPTTWGAVSRYPQSAAVVWVVFLREHRLRGRWGQKSRVYVYLDLGEGRQARRGILRENFILKMKKWENALQHYTYLPYIPTNSLQPLQHYCPYTPTNSLQHLQTYNLPTTTTSYTLHTTPTCLQNTYNPYKPYHILHMPALLRYSRAQSIGWHGKVQRFV
jgi:hypothetical protein